MEFSPQQITYEIRKLAKAPKRILVIDDDASVGAAIEAILGRHQYQTLLASRASDGIQALRKSQFDLVMLDIFMPGLNGLDVLDRIRHDSSIPVIVMSGFRLRSTAQPMDYLVMASERGATLCMRKPFSATELIDAVEWTTGLQRPSERLLR
jgi:DNA-binding response OmpR family regulator